MKFKIINIKNQISELGPELVLSLISKPDIGELKKIVAEGIALDVEIKQHREKRSLDSNSYLWIMCQKIAEAIRSTKELVYQKTIREVGQFEIVPIKNEAADRWIKNWNSKGLGWFAEVMEDSKLEGYQKVISYFGSSVYDSREMSVLINEIVDQAKDLDIETMTPEELDALNKGWRGKNET